MLFTVFQLVFQGTTDPEFTDMVWINQTALKQPDPTSWPICTMDLVQCRGCLGHLSWQYPIENCWPQTGVSQYRSWLHICEPDSSSSYWGNGFIQEITYTIKAFSQKRLSSVSFIENHSNPLLRPRWVNFLGSKIMALHGELAGSGTHIFQWSYQAGHEDVKCQQGIATESVPQWGVWNPARCHGGVSLTQANYPLQMTKQRETLPPCTLTSASPRAGGSWSSSILALPRLLLFPA